MSHDFARFGLTFCVTPSVVVKPSKMKPVINVVLVSFATIGLNDFGTEEEEITIEPPFLSSSE
jgi:hypothetical protein